MEIIMLVWSIGYLITVAVFLFIDRHGKIEFYITTPNIPRNVFLAYLAMFWPLLLVSITSIKFGNKK